MTKRRSYSVEFKRPAVERLENRVESLEQHEQHGLVSAPKFNVH